MPGLGERKEPASENVLLWCYECEQWVEVKKFEIIEGSVQMPCPECETLLEVHIEIIVVEQEGNNAE